MLGRGRNLIKLYQGGIFHWQIKRFKRPVNGKNKTPATCEVTEICVGKKAGVAGGTALEPV